MGPGDQREGARSRHAEGRGYRSYALKRRMSRCRRAASTVAENRIVGISGKVRRGDVCRRISEESGNRVKEAVVSVNGISGGWYMDEDADVYRCGGWGCRNRWKIKGNEVEGNRGRRVGATIAHSARAHYAAQRNLSA